MKDVSIVAQERGRERSGGKCGDGDRVVVVVVVVRYGPGNSSETRHAARGVLLCGARRGGLGVVAVRERRG